MPAVPTQPQKINLRTPQVMSVVQAQVESHYRSPLVEFLRASGHRLSAGGITVILAKAFGFCYGVERAIDLAYAAAKVFQGKRIFLLGEIIHNPEVNDQLTAMGIERLREVEGRYDLSGLTRDDVVIIPAFGAEIQTMHRIQEIGCQVVDTTCGDVMTVWKRVRQYRRENFTSIIHGKAWHEETKATASRAVCEDGGGHYLVVYDLEETDYVCDYIRYGGNKEEFLRKFEGAVSPGFDPDRHLERVGVANQTTMMRGETEEVQRRIQRAIEDRYGKENLSQHFRSFDTICGATQERQDALEELLRHEKLDLLIVVGGYNSSNTSHLAEMGVSRLPTYFIKNAEKLLSPQRILHWDLSKRQEVITEDWLPDQEVTIGITAGASCPNNVIEETIRRLYEFRGIRVDSLIPKTWPIKAL
ncbi:4-hydroxy-3-methylbut-2-enyl diphosphate reductase [Candidatus Methylacidithermus pantelleriae]|uniref:4-hydroxy-3-methylbut-2-enyl diphosphate reductase n=1 Tax=Candidatus Methylacidithermus pantelleriae TaxID=2744239 RepID=A0A8J2FNA5_9BACT|nr:4-hydroxy-3-methylbut-2-enyl diphosphate reductase [Candidatus Methylacidithermus pantelleriae]CAF0689953.1 4-hydroxy-3-methylbut-2-enyl diphosphate reductase [Candidatus Methylacidithermus pantelleriae]